MIVIDNNLKNIRNLNESTQQLINDIKPATTQIVANAYVAVVTDYAVAHVTKSAWATTDYTLYANAAHAINEVTDAEDELSYWTKDSFSKITIQEIMDKITSYLNRISSALALVVEAETAAKTIALWATHNTISDSAIMNIQASYAAKAVFEMQSLATKAMIAAKNDINDIKTASNAYVEIVKYYAAIEATSAAWASTAKFTNYVSAADAVKKLAITEAEIASWANDKFSNINYLKIIDQYISPYIFKTQSKIDQVLAIDKIANNIATWAKSHNTGDIMLYTTKAAYTAEAATIANNLSAKLDNYKKNITENINALDIANIYLELVKDYTVIVRTKAALASIFPEHAIYGSFTDAMGELNATKIEVTTWAKDKFCNITSELLLDKITIYLHKILDCAAKISAADRSTKKLAIWAQEKSNDTQYASKAFYTADADIDARLIVNQAKARLGMVTKLSEITEFVEIYLNIVQDYTTIVDIYTAWSIISNSVFQEATWSAAAYAESKIAGAEAETANWTQDNFQNINTDIHIAKYKDLAVIEALQLEAATRAIKTAALWANELATCDLELYTTQLFYAKAASTLARKAANQAIERVKIAAGTKVMEVISQIYVEIVRDYVTAHEAKTAWLITITSNNSNTEIFCTATEASANAANEVLLNTVIADKWLQNNFNTIKQQEIMDKITASIHKTILLFKMIKAEATTAKTIDAWHKEYNISNKCYETKAIYATAVESQAQTIMNKANEVLLQIQPSGFTMERAAKAYLESQNAHAEMLDIYAAWSMIMAGSIAYNSATSAINEVISAKAELDEWGIDNFANITPQEIIDNYIREYVGRAAFDANVVNVAAEAAKTIAKWAAEIPTSDEAARSATASFMAQAASIAMTAAKAAVTDAVKATSSAG